MTNNQPADLTCDQTRRLFELYADSEGDAANFQQVNRHLSDCEECAAWYAGQLRFESGLAEKLQAEAATSDLWNSVEARIQSTPKRVLAPFWLFTASAAAVVLVALGWRLLSNDLSDSGGLFSLAMGGHERLVDGSEPLQIASESDLEVEAYLKRRVDFPVRCPPRHDAGFVVRGGGVLSLGATPAAFVHGVIGAGKASVFILPRDGLVGFQRESESLGRSEVLRHRANGLGVVVGAIDQNVVIVVGPEPEAELERVLKAYGTYPHHQAAA